MMPSASRWSFLYRSPGSSSKPRTANDQASGNDSVVSEEDFEPTISDDGAETDKWPDTTSDEEPNFDDTVRGLLE